MVKRPVRNIDPERVVRAIVDAERNTTGQIRVSIAAPPWGSVRNAAERAFARLEMTRTPQRNGVLIFVVPARREFVILGDVAIHERVGQEFWERVASAMSERIRSGDLTDGIVHGVEASGVELAAHFPPDGGSGRDGSLPNTVDM
ncbi:MAG TPA: TPM domain-containing protein [Candidatus Eremiobacteraceae bacterium]